MKTYEIIIGSGVYEPYKYCIEVGDYETEQDVLDYLINKIETDGDEGLFIDPSRIYEYNCDEYIIGGNHGRYLYHEGILSIKELIRIDIKTGI